VTKTSHGPLIFCQVLNISGNTGLQLQPGDVGVLQGLPRLALLRLEVGARSPARWSGESMVSFALIQKELPGLKVIVSGDGHLMDCEWPLR